MILEIASVQLPDGRTILVSGSMDHGYDEDIELWDAVTGHPRRLSDGHRWILAVTFVQLPDGRTILASASGDGPIHLWDAVTAEHLSILTGHDDRVLRVASAQLSDGRIILAGASESYEQKPSRATIHMWDPVTGEHLSTVTDSRRLARTMTLTGLADGRALLSTGGGYVDRDSHKTRGVIHLWDIAAEESLDVPIDHDSWVWATALTQLSDGCTILATGASEYDSKGNRRYGVIHLWNALTGRHLNKLVGHNGVINSLEFTQLPDGHTILASCGGDEFEGGDGEVHVWDPITGQQVYTFTDERHMSQTISFGRLPDGRAVLAIGGGNTVRVWDLSETSMPRRRIPKIQRDSPPNIAPSLICTHRFSAQVAALAWSQETSTLAAGLANGSVVLSRLDGASLREQATLLMMPEGNATLYPDGSYRLTGDPDGRFWWSAGLCRFEPGELDGRAGIRRLD
jgi:WD40 repeat protein